MQKSQRIKLSLDVRVATDVDDPVSSRISPPKVPVNNCQPRNRTVLQSSHVTGVNRNRGPDYFYFGVVIHIKRRRVFERIRHEFYSYKKSHLSLLTAVLYRWSPPIVSRRTDRYGRQCYVYLLF